MYTVSGDILQEVRVDSDIIPRVGEQLCIAGAKSAQYVVIMVQHYIEKDGTAETFVYIK